METDPISRLLADMTPHGYCLLWNPWLVYLHAIANGLTALAYFSIPFAIFYFVRRRSDIRFKSLHWLFAIFIMACGLSHVMDILTLWQPWYWLQGGVMAVTAAVSLLAAGVVWKFMPILLTLPSTTQLGLQMAEREAATASLQREIQERKQVEALQRSSNGILEMLAKDAPLPLVLEGIVRMAEALRPKLRCSVLLMDADGRHLRVGSAPSLPDFYNRAVDGLEVGEGAGSCGTAAFRHQRVIVEDTQVDPLWANYRELAAEADLRACWSEPVQSARGEVLGVLAMYYPVSKRPQPSDLELIQSAAYLAGLAIERAKARDEQDRFEAALKDSRDIAVKASQSKSEFLSNVSHEIRTPMNAIIGLSRLAMETGLTAEQQDCIGKVYESSTALLHIINDILDFSKIEAGMLELHRSEFDLGEVLQNVRGLFVATAQQKGLTLAMTMDADVPRRLLGDPIRLSQVLNNLVGNALKFTEQGGVSLRVGRIGGSDGLVRLRFAVQDTGIGLSREEAGRLFVPFTQADGSITRKYGGTGLGLSICKRLVEMMGGEIGVDSEPGKGAIFSFTLELGLGNAQAVEELAVPAPQAPVPYVELAQGIRGARILVAEDNLLNQKVADNYLRRAGLQPVIVANGKEALEAVQRESFDAVLMDLHMPVMDGIDATRRIRLLPGKADLPIIAVTAAAMLQDKEACFLAGMNDHLAKPLDPKELMRVLIKRIAPHSAPQAEPVGTGGDSGASFMKIEGFDFVPVLQDLGGDTAFLRELLLLFRDTLAEARLGMEAAVADQSWDELAVLVHRIKGTAGQVGAQILRARAVTLDKALKFDGTQPDPELLRQFGDELNALLVRLREALPP
ncbi:GAF domain-containing hybrid sensor histidine kinase/response regulator [Methylogaea oryzae]|uniref:Sensory/regulatory protein RpfC n=1 Tax=Methylogaea oryzae TaxID=1295382 RepID=A0A8D5AID3_9GAMM|nr:GAF domain-containing hybrid sensor histidine kinase/response regulator [Methylogaea oryzae]BBL71231.1 hypothetical protein MoryE10_18370 [Methylogaea oryzae]